VELRSEERVGLSEGEKESARDATGVVVPFGHLGSDTTVESVVTGYALDQLRTACT
jgi:hypothetical protein